MKLGSITLSQGSVLDVSANAAGTVRIRSGALVMDNATISADTVNADGMAVAVDIQVTANLSMSTNLNPAITARTSGSGNAGEVRVASADLTATSNAQDFTLALIDTHTSGMGKAGNVSITTGDLQATGPLLPFWFIDSGTQGPGNGGDVTVTARNIIMDQTEISTGDFRARNLPIEQDVTGSGGNIKITADSLDMTLATIFSDAFGGHGGNLTLNVGDIQMNQGSEMGVSGLEGSGAFTVNANRFVMDNGGLIEADTAFVAGRPVTITANIVQLQNGSAIRSHTVGNADAGDIVVTASDHVTLSDGPFTGRPSGFYSSSVGFEGVELDNFGGNAGSIRITTPRLEMSGGARIDTSTQTSGRGGDVTITAGSTSMTGERTLSIPEDDFDIADSRSSGVFSRTVGSEFCSGPCGSGGNITLTGGQSVTISNGASVSANSTGSGNAGNITIQGLASPTESVLIDGPSSGVFTDSQGTGAGGNIFVNADSVTLQNGGRLSAATSGTEVTATGGNITVQADQIALQSGAVITSSTSGTGDGGTVSLYANDSISLINSSIASNSETPPGTPIVGNGGQLNLSAPSITLEQGSALLALTTGSGRAGAIELNHNNLSLSDMSVVQTSTFGPGPAGSITVQGLGGSGTKAHTVLLAGGSSLSSSSLGNDEGEGGAAGNILVETLTLSLSGGSQITTSSIFSPGNAGTITINAGEEVQLSQGILTSRSESNIPDEFVNDYVIGNAGSIIVSAPSVTLKNHSLIASTTDSRYTGDPSKGNAGSVTVNATNLSLTEGSQLTSSSIIGESGQSPVGNAGSVTAQVLASPASSVLISGPGSGLFTETQGTGAGGNIFVDANSVTLTNGATVSASSTGQIENPGAAGSIDITATNGFTMQNSAITTQAGQGASGGDIKVTTAPSATVLLENSRISASVADGPGGGGNISIDPKYVILQNSQILAQAAQGQGGAITITANLFLPDATSIVNADSGSGVNGTVTIQSPNAPASGKIQPLGKTPLLATSLLNQPCAALAGGEFSSFTVAGRDSLPTEPGSWLASPLATLSAGMGREGLTLGASLAGETPLLSLRQIAPAGFLTQAFAVDWSAGCGS